VEQNDVPSPADIPPVRGAEDPANATASTEYLAAANPTFIKRTTSGAAPPATTRGNDRSDDVQGNPGIPFTHGSQGMPPRGYERVASGPLADATQPLPAMPIAPLNAGLSFDTIPVTATPSRAVVPPHPPTAPRAQTTPTVNVPPPVTTTPSRPAPAQSRPLTQASDPPIKKNLLSRVLTRDIPRPAFAGQKLGRAEVERILAVAADANRPGAIDLRGADLREADLSHLNLAGAKFGDDDPLASDSERRDLAAKMDRAQLVGTNLEGAIAPNVCFDGANAQGARLTGANLTAASFVGTYLAGAVLTEAGLMEATLTGANLTEARLDGAVLIGARMSNARLRGAHLEGADLGLVNFAGADLRYTFCDERTHCGGAYLRLARIDGMRFRDMDLTAIDWSPVAQIGEEHDADEALPAAKPVTYRVAARTYRRLGLALRGQGMAHDGNRYLARGRLMEQHALLAEVGECWRGRRYLPTIRALLRWSGPAAQGMFTGYGEHPIRVIGWGAAIGVVFALLYTLFGQMPFNAALLLSAGALVGHGYTNIPTIFTVPGIITMLTVLESAIGTILLLLTALALGRKTHV